MADAVPPNDVATASAVAPPRLFSAQTRAMDWASLAALLVCAVLLFARLGNYGLWDDEANTAVFAANVWKFGDTLAWDGDNLLAFREGLELAGLKNRAYPPGQYFFAAPFLGIFGRNAFAARLPFALAALAGFALWAWWLRKANAPWHVRLVTFLLVVGNASLFLYSRQARYYGLGWALSLALVYLYVHRHESRRYRVLLTVGSVALIAVHYLSYGATMICLGADYLLFELWKKNDTWKQRFSFLGSQALGAAVIVGTFFPFGRKVTPYVPASWWADKLKLFEWNLRDLNACEFMWTPVLGLALVAFAATKLKSWWVLRAALALVIYAFMASILSVQPVGWATVSDIRYMAAAIPLCIGLTVLTLTAVPQVPKLLSVALAAGLAFSTWPYSWFQTVMKAPTAIPARSTPVAFAKELIEPQRSSYREASEWLEANVPAGAKVFAQPDYAVFPLMFHVPRLHYMWLMRQDQKADPAYSKLPDYVFKYLDVPDVLVAFGPDVGAIRGLVGQLAARGVQFEPEVRLGVVGPDRTRPELFWRSFSTDPINNPDFEGTFIFRRVGVRR